MVSLIFSCLNIYNFASLIDPQTDWLRRCFNSMLMLHIFFKFRSFLLNIIFVLCTGSNIYLASFKDYMCQLRIMQFVRPLWNKCDFLKSLRLYNRKLGIACISLENTYNTRHKSLKQEICLEFSPNFLHTLFTPLFSLKCPPLLPQCWATRILEHWNDCKTKSTLGKGKSHKYFKIYDEYCSHREMKWRFA